MFRTSADSAVWQQAGNIFEALPVATRRRQFTPVSDKGNNIWDFC
jgi:hypothetical protein